HLLDALLCDPGVTVYGSGRRPLPSEAERFARVEYVVGDLTNAEATDRIVREARPDWVVHLAAQPSVAESWRDPAGTLVNNVLAQGNRREAVVRHAPAAWVLVVGSSEEYGLLRPEDLPADETTPLRPDNPYATSKVAQDFLGLQYYLGRRLAVVRARPFNLFGP